MECDAPGRRRLRGARQREREREGWNRLSEAAQDERRFNAQSRPVVNGPDGKRTMGLYTWRVWRRGKATVVR